MPKVLLLHTGGTLGMAGGRPSALKPAAFFNTLRRRVPELFELADLELDLFSNVDSCEMQPELWSRMAAHLHRRLPEFDGAVVTHGTDTLALTASALSFTLPSLDKPVVLTGSQRPLVEIRTDARLNLIDAVTSALRGPKEVTICFDSQLFRGNRAQKSKVMEFDAFESPNCPPLGILGVNTTFLPGLSRKGPSRLREKLDARVFVLKVFPGLDPSAALALLPRARGLVLEAYGAGTFPWSADFGRSLRPLFQAAKKQGVPVLVVSQAHRNGVDLSIYESGAEALELGAISGYDLTWSAALVKLMHGLAYETSLDRLARYLQRPVAGELTKPTRSS